MKRFDIRRLRKMPLLINPKLIEVGVEPNTGYGYAAYDKDGELGLLGPGFFKNDLEVLREILEGKRNVSYSSSELPYMNHLDILLIIGSHEGYVVDIVYFDNVNNASDCRVRLDRKNLKILIDAIDNDIDIQNFLITSEEFIKEF